MKQTSKVSLVGRKPPAVGATTRPITHSSSVNEHVAASTQNQALSAVDLPFALDRKSTGLSRKFNWQYVFPSQDVSPNKITGHLRRHHTRERTAQRAFAKAVFILIMF